mmetsp:Transcript_10047/g.25954  ORF Transcript_10047/g.25954 Transcript_10047/m.25954 type:complete len:326 (-) Transcript_10047:1025-2002(-)
MHGRLPDGELHVQLHVRGRHDDAADLVPRAAPRVPAGRDRRRHGGARRPEHRREPADGRDGPHPGRLHRAGLRLQGLPELLAHVRQGGWRQLRPDPDDALGHQRLLQHHGHAGRAAVRPVLHAAPGLHRRHRVLRPEVLRHLRRGGGEHGPEPAEGPGGDLRGPGDGRLRPQGPPADAGPHRLLHRHQRLGVGPGAPRAGRGRLRRRRGHHRQPGELLAEPQGRESDAQHRLLGRPRGHAHREAAPEVQGLRPAGRCPRRWRAAGLQPRALHRLLQRRHALVQGPVLHLRHRRRRLRPRRGRLGRLHAERDLPARRLLLRGRQSD